MPQLGETVTEGTITRWMKAVGDTVARDEPLFEVSTDKVDSEVPSPAAGVLTEILVAEGDTVDVGVRLAVISDSAAAPPSAPATPAEPAAPTPAPAPVVEAPPEPASDAPAASAPAPEPAAPEPVPAPAGAPTSPPPAPPPGFTTSISSEDEARILSPVVRRLLSDNAIDPSEVTGTGLGGRITREDVLAVIDARHAGGPPAEPQVERPAPVTTMPAPSAPTQIAGSPTPPPAATQQAAAPPVAAPPAPAPAPAAPPVAQPPLPTPAPAPGATIAYRQAGERVIPFSNMRRRTAEHMVRSKATSPHAFIAYEADFENVERVRREWGARFKAEEGFSLTYLPFVARASVEALRDFPNLNASVGNEALIVHGEVNLGIAVDLDHEGLIVPVVHRAEEITLRGIARRIRDVADRARTKQLTADDITGGTFSITNDGPFGTYFTVPIINQPQVAILATDGIKRRPVVVSTVDGSESIAIHSVGVLGVSWDHRAVDGAYVSSFLQKLAELLNTRDWAAEL
jgi:pyruvate dehydrogenase E2 component (dihydrolipoamide acetyltransferase)